MFLQALEVGVAGEGPCDLDSPLPAGLRREEGPESSGARDQEWSGWGTVATARSRRVRGAPTPQVAGKGGGGGRDLGPHYFPARRGPKD